jgi:hypothetical protein
MLFLKIGKVRLRFGGQVSVANQSFYTWDALTRATEEWAWMGGMILEHWQPIASADSARWGFAVVDQDNQPYPIMGCAGFV